MRQTHEYIFQKGNEIFPQILISIYVLIPNKQSSALANELNSSKDSAGKELSLSRWCIISLYIYSFSSVIDFSSEKYICFYWMPMGRLDLFSSIAGAPHRHSLGCWKTRSDLSLLQSSIQPTRTHIIYHD